MSLSPSPIQMTKMPNLDPMTMKQWNLNNLYKFIESTILAWLGVGCINKCDTTAKTASTFARVHYFCYNIVVDYSLLSSNFIQSSHSTSLFPISIEYNLNDYFFSIESSEFVVVAGVSLCFRLFIFETINSKNPINGHNRLLFISRMFY